MANRSSANKISLRTGVQALVAGAFLCLSTASLAAVDQFLEIPSVDGESEDATNRGAIDLLAWSWGLSEGKNGRGCRFQDISVTKFVDAASPPLLIGQVQNTVHSSITLTVRSRADVPVIVIVFSDARVTAVSTGGSGGEDRLTENVSFGFETVTYTYTPELPDGSAGTSVEATLAGC